MAKKLANVCCGKPESRAQIRHVVYCKAIDIPGFVGNRQTCKWLLNHDRV
ncbi:hypothetical protein [Caldicellulosiruptor acetigenus]|nr:hypothetical protein [Caldicellulosiruptor acetigenus]